MMVAPMAPYRGSLTCAADPSQDEVGLAPLGGGGDEVLARVGAYRKAARAAVRADRDLRARLAALLDLARAARAEEDPTTRAWAERDIYEEARPLLEEERPLASSQGYEAAQRRLRAEGHTRCPRCLNELASEEDLARWARLRREGAEERRRREGVGSDG